MELTDECVLKQLNNSRSALKNQRRQDHTSDVYIVCDDVKFPAHRAILRVGSKYFEAMFSCELKEKSSDEVTFPTIRKESMEIIIDFIYLQNVNVKPLSDEQVWNLLSAAHMLEVHPLVEVCISELVSKITHGNWAMMLRNAQKYSFENLVLAVVKQMAQIHLSVDNEFLKLDFDSCNALITNSAAHKCHSANLLITFILTWMAHNKFDRMKHLTNLFSVIDFASVSKDVIINLTNTNVLFNDNPELAQCLLQRISQAFNPNPTLNTTNPKLLIFKSNSVYSFDLTRKVWSVHKMLETLMPEPNCQIAVSPQAVYYAVESFVKYSRMDEARNDSQRGDQMHIVAYYPYLNCGNEITSQSKRSNFGMAFMNDALYLVGGISADTRLRSFVCFYFSSKRWRDLAPPMSSRKDPTLVTLDDNLYLLGGRNEQEDLSLIRDVEKYSPVANQWTTINTLRGHMDPLDNVAVAPCLGKIYLINTATYEILLPNFFEFDPKDNSWKKYNVLNCGLLCGSSKSLEYLICLKDTKYYQMDAREKTMVLITQKSDIEYMNTATGQQTETVVIFA